MSAAVAEPVSPLTVATADDAIDLLLILPEELPVPEPKTDGG